MSFGAKGILYRIPPPSYVNQNVHQKPFATLSTACKYMCTCKQPWRAEESLLYLKLPYLILKSTMLKKWRYNQAASFENQCIQLVYLWIREMCYLCPSEILSSLFFFYLIHTGVKDHALFIQNFKSSLYVFNSVRGGKNKKKTRLWHWNMFRRVQLSDVLLLKNKVK